MIQKIVQRKHYGKSRGLWLKRILTLLLSLSARGVFYCDIRSRTVSTNTTPELCTEEILPNRKTFITIILYGFLESFGESRPHVFVIYCSAALVIIGEALYL